MTGIRSKIIKNDFNRSIQRTICSVTLLCIVNIFLFAQEKQLYFTRYTARDGLSNNYINIILQDSRGLLWIATRNGTNTFDGYKFRTFVNDGKPGTIKVARVSDMVEDKRGNIWIAGLGSGLDQYIKAEDRFVHFKHEPDNPNSLIHDDISSFALDKDGNLILRTKGGFQSYNPETKKFDDFQKKMGIDASELGGADASLGGVIHGRDGKLWIGSKNGLYAFDPLTKKMQVYGYQEGAPYNTRPHYEDNEGNIWYVKQGLSVLNPKTKEIKTYSRDHNNPKSISNNTVFHIYEDSKSNLWVTTAEGLNLFNREKEEFTRYYHDPRQSKSISDNTVSYVFEDNSGNLWFGTRLGLNKLINSKFAHYYRGQSENSIIHNNAHTFCETSDRKIWIGTSKGVDVYDLETHLFMYDLNKVPEELTEYPALHMMADHDENIWVGTWSGGITKYNWKINKVYKYEPDPDNIPRHVFYIYEDSKNRIWIGSWGDGMYIYNPEKDNFILHNTIKENGVDNTRNVSCIMEEDDKIIAGTTNGIVVIEDIDNNIWKRYDIIDKTTGEAAKSKYVSCLFKAKNGWLLIGTQEGMLRWDFKSKDMYRLDVSDLLPSTVISAILDDEQNNLWVSTKKGLSKISGLLTGDSVTVMNYKVEDGLQGEDFLDRACLLATDGTMYFGGTNGFNRFRPEKVALNTKKPQVVITSIQLFNKEVNIGDTINDQVVLTKPVIELDELNLSYKNNFLTIEFSALHFLSPEKNQYEYMLEGFDKEWIATDGSRRYATYTDLKGGEYVFKVKGGNSDGIWNEEPKTLKIIVTPPFWKTKWFIITAIIIVITLIYLLSKFREKQLEHDKMALQQKLREGEQQVNNQRNEIQKQGDKLRQREKEGDEMKWYNEGLALFSDIISRNKGELKRLTRSIISKLIEYIEAEQGAIYILNDDDEKEPYLELSASYALDMEKLETSEKILIGESLVGKCFNDKEIKQIEDVPEDYAKINSGLGSKKPNYLILVPIRLDEDIVGVIELTSFKKQEDIKISFLKKLAESVTSIIVTEKANDRMQAILEKSKLQSTQMQEQEEEMRQNIEELRSQQEEAARKEGKLNKVKKELQEQANTLQKKISELKKDKK